VADVCIAIQARLGSSRLPRKIELPFQNSSSLLESIVTKWYESTDLEVFILAPKSEANDPFWKSLTDKFNVFYGDDLNLLKRYYEFSKNVEVENIVRITGDNSFVHKDILKKTLDYHFLNGADYTTSKRDDGAIIPYGIGIEVFSVEALCRVVATKDLNAQEHVSEAFLMSHDIKSLVLKDPIGLTEADLNKLSFTIDEAFQYEFWNNLI
jgi:spore coat polysaccharide biosynthesis protein SpsF